MISTYELNEARILGELPQEIEVVCLKPMSREYKTLYGRENEKYRLLNRLASRLRKSKEHPLVADVLESDVVVLPADNKEAVQISGKGLDKHELAPAAESRKRIPVGSDIYRRLLLRAIEVSLRRRGYIVREEYAMQYLYLATSVAYMYSEGLSAYNRYFEVFRGCAFRLLVYQNEREASLVVDPTYRFVPRATVSEIAQQPSIISELGGNYLGTEVVFQKALEVDDLCPIKPEDCPHRRSPYETDCSMFNQQVDAAISMPRRCYLRRILSGKVESYPRIRDSLKKCPIINKTVSNDTLVGEVLFRGSDKVYHYPLSRLRLGFRLERTALFVHALGGTDTDVSEMNRFIAEKTKLQPSERKWYSLLFIRDLGGIRFGHHSFSLEQDFVNGVVRPWKARD